MENKQPKDSGPEFSNPKFEDLDGEGENDEGYYQPSGEEDDIEESGGVKKVLVTGSRGQLGVELIKVLTPDFDVAGVDIEEMDITNPDDVLSCFYLHHPDIVIHSAAMTDVEGCEAKPEEAFRVNAMGTQNIVAAAREFNSVLLYLSTDYVFDGEKSTPLSRIRPAESH